MESNVVPAGIVSFTVTPTAGFGPALLTVIWYVTLVPAATGVGVPATVMDRSALSDVPACTTVSVWPAIVIVPVRERAPVFPATEKSIVPLPLPFAADVIVIKESLLAAVHAHPGPALIAAFPEPPAAAKPWLTGKIE